MSALKRQERLIRAAARRLAKARLLEVEAQLLLDLADLEGNLAAAEARLARRAEAYR